MRELIALAIIDSVTQVRRHRLARLVILFDGKRFNAEMVTDTAGRVSQLEESLQAPSRKGADGLRLRDLSRLKRLTVKGRPENLGRNARKAEKGFAEALSVFPGNGPVLDPA